MTSPATILCVTCSKPAILFPGVELARRLTGAGHRLVYASWEQARRTVEHHGIDFLPLEASRYDEFLAHDTEKSSVSRLRRLGLRRKEARESLAVDGLTRAIHQLAPDLILIDGEMHEQIIASWSCGVPIALLNSFVSIWRQPGLPPPHCLIQPGVGWKGSRLGTWLLWQALRLKKFRRAWTQKVRRVGCDRLSLLHDLAFHSGFDFRREVDAGQWLMPFTYSRLPVLSLHAEEFEFAHTPPERVRYVGPLLLEDRGSEGVPKAAPTELERIFESCRRKRRVLIFAAFGSYFSTDLAFLHRLVAAVAQRRDWALLISLGGRLDPETLGALPERIHAFRWLPQVDVLRHAAVAVTHGGITTIDECVLSSVPMLLYCGFETDMGGATARVVHHRIGIAGDRLRDSPRAIRESIDRLLNEPEFQTNLNRMRAHYEAYVENRVAERVVESLVARSDAGPIP